MPRLLPGFAYVCLLSHVTKKAPGDFGAGPPEQDYYKSIPAADGTAGLLDNEILSLAHRPDACLGNDA